MRRSRWVEKIDGLVTGQPGGSMGELVSHGEARKPAPARVLLQGCQRQQRSLTQFQEPSRGGGCASTMPEVQVEATGVIKLNQFYNHHM